MFKKIAKFFNDVQVEMSKVSWPTDLRLVNSTMIVAVVSIIFTICIFGLQTVYWLDYGSVYLKTEGE